MTTTTLKKKKKKKKTTQNVRFEDAIGPRNCFILQTIHESVFTSSAESEGEEEEENEKKKKKNENKFCFDCKKKLGVYLHCKFGTLLCHACAEEHKTDGHLKTESGKYVKSIFFHRKRNGNGNDDTVKPNEEDGTAEFSRLPMICASSALEEESDDDEDNDNDEDNDEKENDTSLEEERQPILTELELATLSAGGNRALSLYLKNEHGIIVGNLNAKDRVKFYKECRELRAYRVELAMASSMRMHALREEFKEFLDDYHAETKMGGSYNRDDDKKTKKIKKISDSLGSMLTNIDKELIEEKRREEEERREQQEEEEEKKREGDGDVVDEPRTPVGELKEMTTTTTSSLFSSPTSLLNSIDTSGLNKIGTWVQRMTATATTKSSESDSLTGSSDKENNNDDEKEEMDEAEEGTGKEEDLLDEIETIAEAATSDASSHGANINNRNNSITSSSKISSNSDELLNEIDQIVGEVDDEDDQEDEEKEEDEDENETTTTTTKDRGPSQLPLLKTPSPSRDDIRHKDKVGDDDKEEELDITISSGGSSRLASSPRSVRFVKIRNDAATVVQKHWKGSNDRKAFLKQKHAATTIQSSFRGNKARRGAVREMKEKVKRQEKETKAAIKIQSKFRGSKARITVTELRKEIRRKEEERLVLDAKRERERAERKSAILIQKSFRGMQQRKFYGEIKAEKARHHAAMRIQSLYRGVKTRAQVANECKAQAAFAALEKREAENEKKKRVCILLQAQVRSFFARREAQKLREFAKLKIEAKLYARKRVEERIEAKMNELRMKSARICA